MVVGWEVCVVVVTNDNKGIQVAQLGAGGRGALGFKVRRPSSPCVQVNSCEACKCRPSRGCAPWHGIIRGGKGGRW